MLTLPKKRDFEMEELNEEDLFLDDMDFDNDGFEEYDGFEDDSDDEFEEYGDDFEEYDDDFEEYDDDDFEEYDDDFEEFVDDEDDYNDRPNDKTESKKKTGMGIIPKVLIGVAVAGFLGGGSYFTYTHFLGNNNQPTESLEQVDTVSENNNQGESESDLSVSNTSVENDSQVNFKYSISHAGDASDKLNRMNADFRTATSLYTQNNDLEAYKTALNNIEATRQSSLAELSNHESNELAEAVAAQYKQFFNALNTAFGAQSTDRAVEVFNQWNTMQNEFNQAYTQKLTSMLDQAGIEWSQTETETGLTIVY